MYRAIITMLYLLGLPANGAMAGNLQKKTYVSQSGSCQSFLQLFKVAGLSDGEALDATLAVVGSFRQGRPMEAVGGLRMLSVDTVLAHFLRENMRIAPVKPVYHLSADDLRFAPRMQHQMILVAVLTNWQTLTEERLNKVIEVLADQGSQLVLIWAGKTAVPSHLTQVPLVDFSGSINPCIVALSREIQLNRAAKVRALWLGDR